MADDGMGVMATHESSDPALGSRGAVPVPSRSVDMTVVPEMSLPWDVEHESAWFGHAPFLGWLVSRAEPRVFVELGSHWGFSYFAACAAATSAGLDMQSFAIDTWEGDEHAGHYGDEVFGYVQRRNHEYSPRSRLIRNTFEDACRGFDEGSVDLLHIDGLHTLEAVRSDFEMWLPKMSDRGIVLFHDIEERTGDFGVHVLWDQLKVVYPSFSFAHSHGLGVLQTGAQVPEPVGWLFSLDDASPPAEIVRGFFAGLGSGVATRFERDQLAVQLAEVEADRDRIAEHSIRVDGELEGLVERTHELEQSETALQLSLEREGHALRGAQASLARCASEIVAYQGQINAYQGQINAMLGSRRWRYGEAARHPIGLVRRRLSSRGGAEPPADQVGPHPSQRESPIGSRTGATEIAESLLDEDFYRWAYPHIQDPALHYRLYGATEGNDPNEFFDHDWYSARYGEAPNPESNLFANLLTEPRLHDRDPSPAFNARWYASANSLGPGGLHPLVHFLRTGRHAGHAPSPLLEEQQYWLGFSDVPAPHGGIGRCAVVVLSDGCAVLTERTLRAIGRCALPSLRVTVINTGTTRQLDALKVRFPKDHCRFEWVAATGYARLVNRGLLDAPEPVLFVLRAGDEPLPGYFEGHWARLEARDDAACIRVRGVGYDLERRAESVIAGGQLVVTREAFLRVGGLDEALDSEEAVLADLTASLETVDERCDVSESRTLPQSEHVGCCASPTIHPGN